MTAARMGAGERTPGRSVLLVVLVAAAAMAVWAGARWLGPLREAPTQVIHFVPRRNDLNAGVARVARRGACWTHSIAAPYRADAWRCMVDNAVEDPCFEAEASAGPARLTVICGANPADPEQANLFAIALTRPLPAAGSPQKPGTRGWLVELADGRVCRPFTGTRPFTSAGLAADYGCAPLQPGGQPTYIFGGLNANPRTWTARAGTLKQVGARLPSLQSARAVAVATVWQ